MGLIDKLLSLIPIPVSDRTAIQFHRVHTAFPNGDRQMATYLTGEIVDKPTIVASTADLQMPTDSVLVKHDDKDEHLKINGRPYPVCEYTPHSPSDVPADITPESIPENLRGASAPKGELGKEKLDRLGEILP